MKRTWTSPDQVPAIQRWGVLPLWFAAAGAASGPVAYWTACRLAGGTFDRDGLSIWACVEAGVGLGMGMALVLRRSLWIRLLCSPGLGVAFFLASLVAWKTLTEGRFESLPWGEIVTDPIFWGLALQPFLLGAAHLACLRLRPHRFDVLTWLALYVTAGALWGGFMQLTTRMGSDVLPQGVLQGSIIGSFQLAGMAGAQRFSGVTASAPAPEGAGRTPSS